ncbi:type II toxin-antitoxin system RelE/ParE family toxin [Photorhabdus sp. APURE]|uniref:type II toxin-antitoxin system RelE/ParE family toxin n=1 Tax=Photorhabdus aballayi TaxID=2991723 RepID=UPI00223D862A|nr:type II toxin-antitoxin system RelE/ParE family toxin [Photorhabdus aballayi]MCW7546931.1 type II toxin-antitoxin system RelE/ParE family toxin [Photorhabdus aballayi]
MWEVIATEVFDAWYNEQNEELQDDILAALEILREYGPQLGRPYANTLHSSEFPNMKELRIQHTRNPVRAFFAFDPCRNAIVLCAGDKTGLHEKRFYKDMIKLADAEFKKHLTELER